jgi:hypothetical protein
LCRSVLPSEGDTLHDSVTRSIAVSVSISALELDKERVDEERVDEEHKEDSDAGDS